MIWFGSGLLLMCSLALWAPAARSVDCSKGRSLLLCSERVAIYNDSASWAVGGFVDLSLFAAHLPLHLNNPALAQFWQYETATAFARYLFEVGIINEGVDEDFEQVAPAARLLAPIVKPTGIVTRQVASALSRLLRAEDQEVANLVAMNTALNRATAARINRSRPDWAAWQEYQAARFARQAAAAIGHVIPAAQRVTQAFVHSGLLFGVGPADLQAAQRRVRAHGFPAAIRRTMSVLGVPPPWIAAGRAIFLQANIGPTSYGLTQYLSSASVIGAEKGCANALVRFAARIPVAPQPS
jgi:hypothetical protein